MTGDKLSTYTPPMIPSPGDGADDPEIVYTRAKVDQKLEQILGDRFVPWEARYGA